MAYNYTRLGQANLSGETEALFKDKFIPLLLTRFDELRVMKNLVRHKSLKSGKSASFPIFGKVDAKYIGIGEKITGNQVFAKNETTIMIDPYLISDLVIHDLEERMSETDDRALIAEEMARALANKEDKQLLQVGCLAARSASLIKDGYGGTVLKTAKAAVDGAELAQAIYAAGTVLDNKDVPQYDRYAFVRPLQYNILAQFEDVKDHDIGSGSYSDGTTGKLNNIKIIKTTHLPKEEITNEGTTLPKNLYTGDFSSTACLVLQKEAIATVSLTDIITEVSWNSNYLHYLLTARVAQGHGFLRPECAVEVQSDDMGNDNGLNGAIANDAQVIRLTGQEATDTNPTEPTEPTEPAATEPAAP